MLLNRLPIDKTALTCDVVRQLNAKIAKGEHPEDGVLEARGIAHTAICDSCRENFHAEVIKVRKKNEERKYSKGMIRSNIFFNRYRSIQDSTKKPLY